jgi:hypothetical protein
MQGTPPFDRINEKNENPTITGVSHRRLGQGAAPLSRAPPRAHPPFIRTGAPFIPIFPGH